MRWPLVPGAVGLCLAAALMGNARLAGGQSTPCEIVSIGVDTSLAYPDTLDNLGIRCGSAGGETFYAADTLIRSITVWRHHAETPWGFNMKLWITRVYSDGAPNVDAVLLDGPVRTFPFGDGVHPIEMKWVLDPPFALPEPGEYYFAIQDYCGGSWNLLLNRSDAYPGGLMWRNGITCATDCRLRTFPNQFAGDDLVFTIEFCRDVVTNAKRHSWGRLKLLYR